MAKLLYDCSMYGLKAGDEVEVKYEEDNKMTNYEFHIGDAVVTTDDRYGYVEDICTCNQCKERGFCEPRVVYEDGLVDYITNYEAKIGFKGYKRVGKHVFTKPEKKNKIEPLEVGKDGNIFYDQGKDVTQYTSNDITNIMQKLNEIIAYINKQEE